MLAADSGIQTSAWVNAAASIVVALVVAGLVDRVFRARVVHAAAVRTGVSRETSTRLRFVRRLLTALILLAGVAIALSGFSGIENLARSLLASGVIAAAVVGFAARQVLANFVAGIMLAVTQPLRVGDWVTFEGNSGEVEDVRLNYTILRTPADQRIVIPNERLASSILRNDTLAVDAVGLDVSVWLAPDADVGRALDALTAETGAKVTVAEAAPGGIRLSVGGERVPPADKGAREAELRASCLRRLHAEGLLPAGSA
jgi:small-conductance mechanosensitive channel